MTFRILVCDEISAEGLAILEREADVIRFDGANHLVGVDAIIVRSRTKLNAEMISQASPSLKVIGRAGVGLDNIDLDAARQAGVIVVNTPEATTTAVAEHTLGLILALARLIPQGNASMKAGQWKKSTLLGSRLSGKTLGIIGVGRIGTALAHIVQGLNMNILGCDVKKSEEYLRSHGVEPCTFLDLLEKSDFVSVHVPLIENTRGLINKRSFKRMKPEAYLISTARGGIVDEEALFQALENGELRGAALDVFENEPPGLTPIIQHPRVIVTPHVSAQTKESQAQTGIDVANEVLAALSEKPLRWKID
jgi:D-3-phosphoglycerate dehydrogenase